VLGRRCSSLVLFIILNLFNTLDETLS
jgi:hypothetical protein